jgi:hypothetical protein
MKHPSERLEELIQALGHNLNSFSMECGYVNSTTIWSIIAKKKKPTTPTLNKICKAFPNVNRRWLISGNESMFIDEPIHNSEELTVTAKQVLDKIVPLIPSQDIILQATQTLNDFINNYNHVKEFVKDFEATWKHSLNELEEVKKDIKNINAKITTMQLVTGYEAIKKEQKEKNRNGQ